jgi:hypothetical protein
MAAIATIQPVENATRLAFDERRELLAMEVSRLLALGNRRIESYSDLSAVLVFGKPVNHVLHLLATVLTAGIWGFVWIVLALTGGERRELIRIDEAGNITVEQLPQ